MTVEVVTGIQDFVETNPPNTDIVKEGAQHIRNMKHGILETFPNIDAPVTVTEDDLNSVTSRVTNTTQVIAGAGMTGGGALSGDVTVNVIAGTGITVNANDVALDTASTRNTDHAGVSVIAGAGMTGGGAITSSVTLNVIAGDGVSVAADSVAVDSTVLRTTGAQGVAGVKAFSDSPTVPTPSGGTDAANKDYVDTAAGSPSFGGQIDATSVAAVLPAGWSSILAATGRYDVTHNLGHTNYAVVATMTGIATPFRLQVAITSRTGTSFRVNWWSATDSIYANVAFDIVVVDFN